MYYINLLIYQTWQPVEMLRCQILWVVSTMICCTSKRDSTASDTTSCRKNVYLDAASGILKKHLRYSNWQIELGGGKRGRAEEAHL